VKKLLGNSVIKDLYILNYPVHCFYVKSSQGLVMQNIILNNTMGDLPNAVSSGIPAGHNTDGFGYSLSDNIILKDSKVWNQDDCVAITSGNNITVSNLYCYGGHGLSIGSVGGKNSQY
jgi:polygalacturonase